MLSKSFCSLKKSPPTPKLNNINLIELLWLPDVTETKRIRFQFGKLSFVEFSVEFCPSCYLWLSTVQSRRGSTVSSLCNSCMAARDANRCLTKKTPQQPPPLPLTPVVTNKILRQNPSSMRHFYTLCTLFILFVPSLYISKTQSTFNYYWQLVRAIKPKIFVVSENPTDHSFNPPYPKNFMDFILGPIFFGFNFHRGLPASSWCIMSGSSFH